MVSHRPARRGDIDFFLIIAILLIFIVGASTAGGRLGGLGKSLQKALGSIFGTEPTPCPFLQKGALSGFLGLESESKIVGVYNTTTLASDDECPTSSMSKIRLRWSMAQKGLVFDMGDDPDFNLCPSINLTSVINPTTQELISGSMISAKVPNCTIGGSQQYICCDRRQGACVCSQEDAGQETSPIPGRTDKFYCGLRYYLMTEGLGFSSQAATDAQFGAFASRPMPSYICIIIFGIIPFLVMYYLIQDLFFFVMLSQTTKKMMAVAMAGIAIVTGAFADLAYVLTKLTNISLSWSFLFLIFGTGLVSIVITNLIGVTSAASAMHKSLNEALYGFNLLRTFGKQLEEVSKKE